MNIEELKSFGIDEERIEKILLSTKKTETINIDTDYRRNLRNKIALDLSMSGSFSNEEQRANGKVKKEKRLDIVIGIPAAGKSSALANPLSSKNFSVVIDSDMAKEKLPEFDGGYGASVVHEESKEIFMKAIEYAMIDGKNIVAPIVGKSESSIQKLIDLGKKYGYEYHLSLNELDLELAIKRALKRFEYEDRFVDPDYIRSVGDKPLKNYNLFKTRLEFKSYNRVSNNVKFGEPPIQIEYVTKKELEEQLKHSKRKDTNLKNHESIFDEEVKKIKNILITDFCNYNGIQLKGNGRYLHLEIHDSCVIDTYKNEFYWNSRQKNGDIINFVQELYNVNFKEAITIITNKDLKEITHSNINNEHDKTPKIATPEEIQISFENDLKKGLNMKRTFAYLTKKRNIDTHIINEFVKKGLLIQDDRNNATFKMKDKNDKLIGIVKKGTGYVKLEYINEYSDIKGFAFRISDNPKKAYFTEAPVDLMSFYELKKNEINLDDAVLISMQGVKHNCVLENIKHYKGIEEIGLCVDNDKGGHKFINNLTQNFKDELNGIKINIYTPVTKDWNEDLSKYKEKQLLELNEKDLKITKAGKEGNEKYVISDMISKKTTEFTNVYDAKKFVLDRKKELENTKKKVNIKGVQR